MKFIFCFLALFSLGAIADDYVEGYTRDDGTYVPGHFKTEPNDTLNDNYSTKGNVNPYTGEPGTQPRDMEIQEQEDTAPFYQNNNKMRNSNWQF